MLLILAIPHGHRNRVVQNKCPDEAQDQLQLAVDNVRRVCRSERRENKSSICTIVVKPGTRRTVSSTRNRHKVNISINCSDHLRELHLGRRQAPSVNGNTRSPPCCNKLVARTSYQLCARYLLTVTTTCCTQSQAMLLTNNQQQRCLDELDSLLAWSSSGLPACWLCRLHATNLSGRFRDKAETTSELGQLKIV